MSSDIKPTLSQQENDDDQPKKQKGAFARHCARFWWAHLIAFILITVLVVILIIFVAVPKIAQSKINAAELSIDGIFATGTQSQNYTMSINSTIRTDGSVQATIEGFTGVMYLEDLEPHTPFAEIGFPQTTSDALQTVNVSQFIPITNMAAFTTFNTWLLKNDSLRVTITGDTTVYIRGLSKGYSVNFKKTVSLPGLRNFDGTAVPESVVSLEPDANGNNFKGVVTIPNYSIVTFEIGNATFHNYLLGAEIGTVFIDNMLLRPGLNNFTMRATIDQGPVLKALGQKPYCENGGQLPFQLSGKDVVNNGQRLSYYADALASGNQTVTIDIGGDLKKHLNLTIPCAP